jgi:hypothetical protein
MIFEELDKSNISKLQTCMTCSFQKYFCRVQILFILKKNNYMNATITKAGTACKTLKNLVGVVNH